MGSVDKGLQPFRGASMVSHVVERLGPQVRSLLINANQNQASYEALGWPVWPDAMPDFAGPLAGLQTGLMHCDSPYLVTAPCDSPFLPADLVERLTGGLLDVGADLAVAVTGDEKTRQIHPVFCLVSVSVLPHLTVFLQKGGRKVDAWFASLKVAEVHFSDEAAFQNINTLEELKKLDTH